MNLHKLYLTKNECYQAAAPIVPAGIKKWFEVLRDKGDGGDGDDSRD